MSDQYWSQSSGQSTPTGDSQKKYVLTEEDVYFLKMMAADYKTKRANKSVRTSIVPDQTQAPEVYIAWVPAGGIPALVNESGVGSSSGSNDPGGPVLCNVYQLRLPGGIGTTPGQLFQTINQRYVWNLSSQLIAGKQWILAVRDKFGQWIADVPNAQGGNSSLTYGFASSSGSSANLASSLGSWVSNGLIAVLPTAGTYFVTATVNGYMQTGTAGGQIVELAFSLDNITPYASEILSVVQAGALTGGTPTSMANTNYFGAACLRYEFIVSGPTPIYFLSKADTDGFLGTLVEAYCPYQYGIYDFQQVA